MSKRKFSASERHAVYTVHGAKCYLGGEPLDLKTMEVDHILPEALLKTPYVRRLPLVAESERTS